MDIDRLQTIYLFCVAIGILLPLLNIIFGAFGGVCDLDCDCDGVPGFDSILPLSVHSFSLSVVVFGALGRLVLVFVPIPWVSIATALPLGIAAGWLLYHFVIQPLKKSLPRAQSIEDLLWKDGTVKMEIRQDFVGSITVLSATGSFVTYDAKPVQWIEKIPAGEKVIIVEVEPEKNLCIVSPLEENTL